jgi:hypothetical protein
MKSILLIETPHDIVQSINHHSIRQQVLVDCGGVTARIRVV